MVTWGLLFPVHTCRDWGSELGLPGVLGRRRGASGEEACGDPLNHKGIIRWTCKMLCFICKHWKNIQKPETWTNEGWRQKEARCGYILGLLECWEEKKMVKGQSFSGYFSYQDMHLNGMHQRWQEEPGLCASICVCYRAWAKHRGGGHRDPLAKLRNEDCGQPWLNKNLLERQTTVRMRLSGFLVTQSLLVRGERSWLAASVCYPWLSGWGLLLYSQSGHSPLKHRAHCWERKEDEVS